MHIAAARSPMEFDARSPVWTAKPNRAVSRRPVQVVRFGVAASRALISRFSQVGHNPSLEAFRRNGENTLDSGSMFGMAKGRVTEQRANRR